MAHMGEAHEAGERVNADPFRRLLVNPGRLHLLDLRFFGATRGRILRGCHGPAERPLAPADDLVTAEARLHRGDSGLTRHGDRAVTIQAGDLVLAGVDVVTKEDRLTGTGKFPRVGDDASGGGRCGLSVLRRGWAGNEESDSDAGRGPTTPLRHQSRSMANVLFVGGTACGAGM